MAEVDRIFPAWRGRCLLCNWQRTRGRLSSTCAVGNTRPHALGQRRNYLSPASVLIPIKASPTSSNASIGELLLDDQGHVVWVVLGLRENAEASGLRFKNTASCDEQGVQGAILCPDGFWQTAKLFLFPFPPNCCRDLVNVICRQAALAPGC